MTDVASNFQQQRNTPTKQRSGPNTDRSELLHDDDGAPEMISGGDTSAIDDDQNGEDEDIGDLKKASGGGMGQSPRYEAFVMTGEKMLRLNSKISPNYAKVKHAELPRHIEVLDSPPTLPRGPFADLENATTTADAFGAQRRSKRRGQGDHPNNGHHPQQPIPPSQSENGLASTSSTSSSTATTAAAASIMTTVSNEKHQQTGGGGDRFDNGHREPSLVTVHGFHQNTGTYKKNGGSSDTDGESRSTLHSTAELTAHGVGVGADMPSPTSPSYYSEPVSPARFAFHAGGGCGVGPMGSDSPSNRRYVHQIQKHNGDASSPSMIIRAHQLESEEYLKNHLAEMISPRSYMTKNGNAAASPSSVHRESSTNGGGTLIINVSQQTPPGQRHHQHEVVIPTSVIVTGTGSDSESPSGSVHSTPLKERIQRFEAASRSSSSSTTAKELDAEAAKRLAKRLFTLEGFRKSDVAKHLVKNNEFSNLVALEYLNQFNLAGLRIDAAIRKFLHHFTLIGETSERERIISYFSKRYYECNPGLFSFEDEVHTLTCALLLLNTDLHSPTVSKKMSCHDFIENISQAGYTFPRDLLKALYQSIKTHPIEWAKDQSDTDTNASGLSGLGRCDSRFLEMPDPDSQVEYKKGWVMRKSVIDEDGKPMPFGRRSWRMFYATLKGMVLYLHKDEHGFRKSSYQTFRNAIRTHHALAARATDYMKKQHVFRLHTAGLAEFLFQTSDPKEMQSWIDAINFVAACFSAPVLPPPVSARQSFHRPLLPSGPTKLSMREQCNAHESRVQEVEKLIHQHRYAAPARTAKPRQMQEFAEKEIFLLFDLQKYTTYAQLLKQRLDEQMERTTTPGLMETSITTVASDATTTNEDGSGCLSTGGRFSAQSGQSDRLSYRAAIACTMGPTNGGQQTTRAPIETNL